VNLNFANGDHNSIKKSLIYSLSAHVFLFIILIVGIPSLKQDLHEEQTLVVDIVNVSELTNIRTQHKNIAKEKKPAKASKEVEDKKIIKQVPEKSESAVTKPSISKPIIPQVALNPQPLHKIDAPKKIEEHKEMIKKDMVSIKKEEKFSAQKSTIKIEKKVEKKEKIKKPIKDKKQDDYSVMILKSVKNNSNKNINDNENILDKKFQELEELIEGEQNKNFKEDLEVSISELDAIRSQINNAWNVIAFNKSGNIMRVTLLMQLDKSGAIIQIKPILENNSNPSYNAFVESVKRAAKKASPLQNLPPNKFQSWNEIEMNFSSENMM